LLSKVNYHPQWGEEVKMAQVNQKFVDGYLFGKMLESIKPLNQVIDALDPSETKFISRIRKVIQEITSIEL
jgi:hypothetical protein